MGKMITNLRDLCDELSADSPSSLNRRIYKDTACGASISIYPVEGEPIHNGDRRWESLDIDTPIKGFTIQTIVEGSDAEINSELFELPVDSSDVENWIEQMEERASELWDDAKGYDGRCGNCADKREASGDVD